MLEIRDLHVRYSGIQACRAVSLSSARGSIVILIGANGAGKSSIIRSIAGLSKTISGRFSSSG
ncbi:ATP-binding cassette domain-containing protein [uncultured Desulfovibrio sp.]|uniref:ATP-binding cassette domain-containing protein n=1 Tax=uncultured Desulfovibrio sp. TaxID=167968 RepID=UPI0003A490C1|nr:ATP-binding cassette domain-containing protein [uncultured Desulfovibrio sp.]